MEKARVFPQAALALCWEVRIVSEVSSDPFPIRIDWMECTMNKSARR